MSTQNFSFILYSPPARRHYHRQWATYETALAQLRKVEVELGMLMALAEGSRMVVALQPRLNGMDHGFSDLCQTLAGMKMELELVDALRKRICGDE